MAASAILTRAVARKFLTAYRNSSSHNVLSHGDPKQIEAAYKMWKNLTFYAVPVVLALGFANVYLNEEEEEKPEFIAYDHLRIRTKKWPWGDGNHSLFHNPHVNALPSGYEDH